MSLANMNIKPAAGPPVARTFSIPRDEFFAPSLIARLQTEGEPEPGGKPTTKEPPDLAMFQSATANDDAGTIDCVWYGGATVPRIDYDTGDPYMLRLNMEGCRMERMNAGAPVFDTHFTGDDFKSIVAGKVGTKAQLGVVRKAWADGDTGKATVQFDLGTADGAEAYRRAKAGITQNLSFGTWIYKRNEVTDSNGEGRTLAHASGDRAPLFEATDWEPFELGPCTIPADFSTQFLTAAPGAAISSGQPVIQRAASPQGDNPMEPITAPGAARPDETQLAALRAETLAIERKRVADIEAMGATHKLPKLAAKLIKDGTDADGARSAFTRAADITNRAEPFKTALGAEFIEQFINEGRTPDDFSSAALAKLAKRGQVGVNDKDFPIVGEASITRDTSDTFVRQLEAAMIFRTDANFYESWAKPFKKEGGDQLLYRQSDTAYTDLLKAHREQRDLARKYASFSLVDMAREYLEATGVNTRGLYPDEIARRALVGDGRPRDWRMSATSYGEAEFFNPSGAEAVADFPSILANVANKFARQGYEAFPRTFQPFCKQMTAKDFKPVNLVQMSDTPALQEMNDAGEYNSATVKDSNQSFTLAPYGRIIRITRQAIINDSLQMFTRVPASLGVGAARMESDKVWGVITGNPVMGEDGLVCFVSGHNNYFTGAGSALALGAATPATGLTAARSAMRKQVGPQGTYLNLVPKYILLPTSLESTAEQLTSAVTQGDPLAPSSSTNRLPLWTRQLIPIVEPRLDAVATVGSTAWYLVADPMVIDTVATAFLEGQAGLFIETRQGFASDAMEIKAREDFAVAIIDYRALQYNAGQ